VRSIPLLREALKDKNIHVDFAASNALLSLGDSSGYAIYYEVLIGKRKSGEGPVEEQKRLIKDPKAMTLMMLGTAAGFAPYAGYGWAMFQVISKDYAGPVRVEAVQKLAKDADAQTEAALIKAASNKNWKLRVAALESLAQRGDPRLADTLASHLSDKNQAVRSAAAAGFIRLSGAKEPEIRQSRALP
jgi:HEAT repeat protein